MPPKTELEILECAGRLDWERWLLAHHADSPGVWLKIVKKGSGSAAAALAQTDPAAPKPTTTQSAASTLGYPEALEVAICHGWIDGQKRALDESFWLQRFTRRGPRSKWSQINRDKATELIAQGRMTQAGMKQVQAAQADGRWDAAYEPQSRATVPLDLQRALDQNPAAQEFFATLTGARRYAFLYRLHQVSDPLRRAQRIAHYIGLLSDGRTLN